MMSSLCKFKKDICLFGSIREKQAIIKLKQYQKRERGRSFVYLDAENLQTTEILILKLCQGLLSTTWWGVGDII